MKLNKSAALGAVFISAIALVGCSGPDGDSTTISIDASTTGSTGGGSTVSQTCPAWSTPKNRDTTANKDVCALPSTILEDRNLTNDIIWLMEGRVTVGNGNGQLDATGKLASGQAPVNVELSVQAGTEIRGLSGTFANMIITRGSKIFARGTSSQPIIMSSSDAGLEGTGEWGGLIIHGYAPHNSCYASSGSFLTVSTPNATCNVDAEGESGFAGGFDATDDSGIIEYLVLAEGGFEFAEGNEINGISFVAVGSGTEVNHIQVHNNADDGVEFYGGSVSISHLVLTSNFDDSVDWDEGWQGNLQYVIVKQNATEGGNAIEADTTGASGTFHSLPFISNAVFIGGAAQNDLGVFKASSAGIIINSIFTGLNNTSFVQHCIDTNSASSDADTLVFINNIFFCNNVQDGTRASISGTIAGNPALNANYAATLAGATLGAPTSIAAYTATASLFDNKTANASFLNSEGFAYVGAVKPGTATPWWSGWIVPGSL